MMQPVQFKMARAALGWTVEQVASRAGVSPEDLTLFENGGTEGVEAAGRARTAYEQAGIAWIGDDGVRLQRPPESGDTIALENLNSANDE